MNVTSIELTEAETTLWEDDGPDGDEYRARLRGLFRDKSVEIYSHDGIVLDAWQQEGLEG